MDSTERQASSAHKRTRKMNWSPDETKFLVELYRENVKYLKCEFASPGTSHRGRLDAWDRIAASLHTAYPSADRTVKECQKRWQTIQSLSSSKIARYNEAANKTGKNFAFSGESGHPVHPP